MMIQSCGAARWLSIISQPNNETTRFSLPKQWKVVFVVMLISFCAGDDVAAQKKFDTNRLAHPEVAKQLELSDAQSAKIVSLIAESTKAYAAAEPAKRVAVRADFDQKILAVLNESQKTKLAEIDKVQPLTFNFHKQSWTKVLQWFAEQSDLPLIMNQTPEGEFSYTDSKEFTPAQAIDLLNRVLLVKGFTLLRNEKMLILVESKNGVPDSLVPEASLEKLEGRGEFELVKVTFQLGKRPLDSVTSEIQPIVNSQYGKVIPLRTTNRIMVTEVAGKMQAINALIMSIPEPKPKPKPKPPAPKPKPPAPIVAVYQLKNLEPESTTNAIQGIVGGTLSFDKSAKQITAFAPPAQQASIKTLIEQMEKNAAALPEPSFQRYKLRATLTETVQAQIQQLSPDSKFVIDNEERSILIYATPDEQAKIKASLTSMNAIFGSPATTQTGNQEVGVYKIKIGDPEKIAAIIRDISPNVTVTADSEAKTVVVKGTLADQAMVQKLVDQFQEKDELTTTKLKIYQLSKPIAEGTLETIASLVPEAKLNLSESTGRLSAMANTKDHAIVQQAIDQIGSLNLTASQSKLSIYEVQPDQKTRFTALFESLAAKLPGAKIIPDENDQELAIWALPSQHEMIAQLLLEMKSKGEKVSAQSMVAYKVTAESTETVVELIKEQFPKTKINFIAEKRTLLVWADKKGQANLKAELDKLQLALPAAEEPTYEFYSVKEMDATELSASLAQLAPEVTLTIDAAKNRVIALGKKKDHEKLSEIVNRFEKAESAKIKTDIKLLPLGDVPSELAIEILTASMPDATIKADTSGKRLIVNATDANHTLAKTLLDQLASETKSADVSLAFYDADPSIQESLSSLLAAKAPSAVISYNALKKQFSVVANAQDQEKIKTVIQGAIENVVPSEKEAVKVYEITDENRARYNAVLELLSADYPGIRAVEDSTKGQMTVIATPTQHEAIGTAFAEISKAPVPSDQRKLSIYNVPRTSVDAVIDLISELFPEAKAVADKNGARVLIWADEENSKKIKTAMEQFSVDKPAADNQGKQEVISYDLKTIVPSQVTPFLIQLYPEMTIWPDNLAKKVIAFGYSDEHERFKLSLKQLQSEDATDPRSIKAYDVGDAAPASIKLTLDSLVKEAQIVADAPTKSVICFATELDHAKISKVIDQIKGLKTDQPLTAQVYKIENASPTYLSLAITKIIPKASISVGLGEIYCVADSVTQTRVATIVKQFEESLNSDQMQLTVHRVEPELMTRLTVIITSSVKKAKIVESGTDGTLVVMASEPDHAEIKQLIDRFQLELKTDKKVVKNYASEKLSIAQLSTLLTTNFSPTFLPLDNAKELTIWATEKEHAIFAEFIAELETQIADLPKSEIKIYRTDQRNLAQIKSILTAKFENLKFLESTIADAMIIQADTEMHQSVAAEIKKIESELGSEKLVLRSYFCSKVTETILVRIVMANFEVTALPTGHGDQMTVWATEADHAKIKVLVDQLESEIVSAAGEVKIYKVDDGAAAKIRTVLQTTYPDARFVDQGTDGTMIIQAIAAEHAAIAKSVESLKAEFATSNNSLKTFPVDGLSPLQASEAIMAQHPSVKIIPTGNPRKLTVWANESQLEKIEGLLTHLKTSLQERVDRETKVYEAGKKSISQIYAAMDGELLSQTSITEDGENNRLIVRATKETQAAVKAQFEQLLKVMPDEKRRSTLLYELKNGNATSLLTVFRGVIPSTYMGVDRTDRKLIVTAFPDEHKMVQQIVDEMNQSGITKQVVKVYPFKGGRPQAADRILDQLLPDAQISYDAQASVLVAVATPEDHLRIKETVDEMQKSLRVEKSAVIYKLKGNPRSTSTALISLLPMATVTFDVASQTITAVATEEEHARIQQIVDQVAANSGVDKIAKVYDFRKGGNPRVVDRMLDVLLPEASVTYDREAMTLIAAATEEEHKQIAAIIEQMSANNTQERVSQIFELPGSDLDAIVQVVESIDENAETIVDSANGRVIVFSDKEKQTEIAEMVQKVGKPSENVVQSKVYQLKYRMRTSSLTALVQSISPTAAIGYDPISGNVVVVARPQDQTMIESTFADLNNREDKRVAKVYDLPDANLETVAGIVESYGSEAQIVLDEINARAVVIASPEDQIKLSELIDQVKVPSTSKLEPRVYEIKSRISSSSAAEMVESISPTARVVIDEDAQKLIVSAKAGDHALIQKTIDQMNDAPNSKLSKVYRFEYADPETAQRVLEDLTPTATIAVDESTKTLIASGSATDHKIILETVTQLDNVGDDPRMVVPKSYYFKSDAGSDVAGALSDLFGNDERVSINYGEKSRVLIAVAAPQQHETIQQIVAAAEASVADAKVGSNIQVYQLRKVDGDAVATTVQAMFDEEVPKVTIAFEEKGNQIVAMANAEQQVKIKEALAQFKEQSKEFATFRLAKSDPFTIEFAIDDLFKDVAEIRKPSVNSDYDNNQIFIHGTLDQIAEIKKFLTSIGEVSEPVQAKTRPANSTLRVIESDNDLESILRQIQTVWPKVRKNELKIISPVGEQESRLIPFGQRDPSEIEIVPGEFREKVKRQKLEKEKRSVEPIDRPTKGLGDDSGCGFEVLQEGDGNAPSINEPYIQGDQQSQAIPDKAKNDPATQQSNAGKLGASNNRLPANEAKSAPVKQTETGDPIIVIPGDGKLTIASNDVEALEQFEALVRAVLQKRTFGASSNFSVFQLRNGSAQETSQLLNGLFEKMPARFGGNAMKEPVVIADSRLNVVIVHGSKQDRAIVGELLSILDASDIPATLNSVPQIVKIKNADATRIQSTLQSIYKTQMASGGGRKQVSIPEGVSSEVESVLRQINAATAGPLLTLEVDKPSNSIIMLAPKELALQVSNLIASLDKPTEIGAGKSVNIIQLKKSKTGRIIDALNLLIDEK